MRVLLVGAGASISIKDVERGYLAALRDAGVDVKLYLLDQRIDIAQRWLKTLWRERGRPPEQRPSWPDVIYRAGIEALEMALRFDVDWVLAISGMYLHPDVLELMRRAHLRTAVLFTESPYQDQEQARLAQLVDVCWTNERTSVSFLRQFNPCTFYVRHAYDPERHQPVAQPADVAEHDVVFVGSGFQERLDLLASVDWSGIDLGLYGTWTLLPARHPLRRHIRSGLIDNDMAAALYSRAKIGLNLHRRSCHYERAPVMIPRADSMNPRAYELAACGIFQISDRRAEVQETFGTSVPTFDDPAALERLVRLALADDAGRTYLAEQARLAIAPHTFAARAAQLIAELESLEQRPIAKGA